MAEEPIPCAPADRSFHLYWLKDSSCSNIVEHGYVGVTSDTRRRLATHRRTGRFPVGFAMEIVFSGSQPDCLQRERELRPLVGIGWNLAVGGPGGYRYGHSEETRRKIGLASKNMSAGSRYDIGADRRGKNHSAEHSEKISKALTGKKASPQTRDKLRAAHLGKKPTAETRAKMSQASLGRQHSPETRAKMSERAKNRSAETREKMSASQRGVKKSPESIEKMAATKRGKPWSDAARAAHATANTKRSAD